MLTIFIILFFILFSSCSTKYKGLHADYKKFSKSINYCIKKLCRNKNKSILYNFSIISSAHAYSGVGEGMSNILKDKVSYKTFIFVWKKKDILRMKAVYLNYLI